MDVNAEALRGYMDYLRDLGIYDVYRTGEPSSDPAMAEWLASLSPAAGGTPSRPSVSATTAARPVAVRTQQQVQTPPARKSSPFASSNARHAGPDIVLAPPVASAKQNTAPPPTYDFEEGSAQPSAFAPPPMPLVSFNQLAPLPQQPVAPVDKAAALQRLRETIGDCTRCPLAYAGRHTIVFADGDPNAQLMFVGEGPGADEDETGVPFVGKAGQLLNNMINAMGLKREQVYIANIVKCRPPKNRVPEPVEANTCSQFLLQQIDIVQPKIIVALGSTAATYLLGVRSSLAGLRGQWHEVRGAKAAVTFHPAFLLRDPRQKGEAWKDLQRVMLELGLKPTAKA